MYKFREDIKLGLAMPLSWPYINSKTHLSLMCMDRPNFIYLETARGGDLGEKRDNQVLAAKQFGCTEMVLMDADMIYPDETIRDLYRVMDETGADMVGGLCYRGYEPYDPMIYHPTEERLLVPFRDFKFGDIVDAGATGAACLLIKMKVFEKLERPWFQIHIENKTVDGKGIAIKRGEDTYFTRNATRAGFKLKIMTSYDIGHLREIAIDRNMYFIIGILYQIGSWKGVVELFKKTKDPEWLLMQLGVDKSKKEVK